MSNESNISVADPFYVNVYEWTKHSTSVFVSASFLLGIPGNLLVVLVHCRIKEKTVTDWMLFYIAICDIMSLINAPLYVLQFQKVWALGAPDFLCKFHYFNLNSVSMASYFCCAGTALERYYKVVYSREIFSPKCAKVVWVPIFIISFSIGALTILAVANNANGHCMYDVNVRYLSTIEYALILSVAFMSSIVMSTCYIKIGMFLTRKMKEIGRAGLSVSMSKSYRNTIQTTKMLGILTTVFLISANVPYISGIFFTAKRPEEEPLMTVMMFLGLSFFVNNFFNPFLYIAMSAVFRTRALAILSICSATKGIHSLEHTRSSSTPNTSMTELA